MLKIALVHFFIKLAVGILPCLPLIPVKAVGESFSRLLVSLAFISSLLGFLIHDYTFDLEYMLLIIFVITLFLLFFMIRRLKSSANVLILVTFLLGVIVLANQNITGLKVSWIYSFLNFLLGAFLLGFSVVSMILGHWYLIRPQLSFDHLIRFVRIFFVLALVRTSFIVYVLFLEKSGECKYLLGQIGGIFFFTRVLWGIILPLIFLIPAYRCARIHSNRSATGILYFTTGAVLMGEIMADFLTMISGISL